MGCPNNLKPSAPGEIRNPYGPAGKPENREMLKERRMKKKIITDAIYKELGKVIDDEGTTVLDKLVQKAVEQAGNNEKYFSTLLDRVEGPVKTDMNISSDTGLGVVILPSKE